MSFLTATTWHEICYIICDQYAPLIGCCNVSQQSCSFDGGVLLSCSQCPRAASPVGDGLVALGVAARGQLAEDEEHEGGGHDLHQRVVDEVQ